VSESIRVYKLNEKGQKVLHYDGVVLTRKAHCIHLEAIFTRQDYVAAYHTFRQKDRMLEWFYDDRWYNIFQMHDVDDDRLKGWYCNVTRPAQFKPDGIYAEDLALDLMVYPNGHYVILDEDEFDALDIDPDTRQNARQGLQDLIHLVHNRQEVFAVIP
jgi:uncharacterized protein